MAVKLDQIRIGSTVMVRENFGTSSPKEVTVLGIEENIKNGAPGIDYLGKWAYLHQVDMVIKY